MDDQKPARAPYRSRIRARHAAQTQRLILDAATELFVERGYAATSIDAIAERAGVGRSTVFTAAGGKPWLVKTAYDRAVVGDDEPVTLAERPEGRHLASLSDATEIVAAYAAILAPALARVSAVHEVIRSGSDVDPEVGALWRETHRQRLTGARTVVDLLSRVDGLAVGLSAQRATDIVTVYNDPGLHRHLVGERGWSQEEFRDWLAGALRSQLVDPPVSDRDR